MKRLLALATLFVALHAGAASTAYVDYSGTITLGGTSQTLRAATSNGGRVSINNLTTETEVLCVNVTSAASCTAAGSWQLKPGETLTLDTDELITIVAATTGHKFTAKRVTEGFAGAGPGAGSGGGGAGDASAANQTTQITAEQAILATAGATTDAAAADANGTINAHVRSAAKSAAATDARFTATANADAARLPVSVEIASPASGSSSGAGDTVAGFAVGKSAQCVIVAVTAISSATANFQFSPDGTAAYTATNGALSSNSGSSSLASSTTSTGVWYIPVRGTHFKVAQTNAGSITATAVPVAGPCGGLTGTRVENTVVTSTSGPGAHDSAISGSPVRTGCRARTTAYATTIVQDDTVDTLCDPSGATITKPYAPRGIDWVTTVDLTDTTSTALKAAGGTSVINSVTWCYASGVAATTATQIKLLDGSTLKVPMNMKAAGGDIFLTFPTPVHGSSNTAMNVQLSGSPTGTISVTCGGYTAA